MTTTLTESVAITASPPLVLRFQPALQLTEDQFFEFCQINGEIRMERTATGEIEIMAPAGFDSGSRNARITMQVTRWALQNATGVAGDSSTGFRLPNKAVRAPDASWISNVRLNQVPLEARRKFLPACPEFVIELLSPSDLLSVVQAKMQEYLENGALLGVLLNPETKTVEVYRPHQPVESFQNLESLSCEPELPGFVLMLQEIW